MDPQLQFKLNLYQNSPDVFNDDELDLLKGQLESAGVDKSVIDGVQHAGPKRNSGFSLARTIGNFLEGTIEGATTLSAGVTKPQNTTETIARSLGSLAGFVGTFPIGGGVLSTGLKAGSKALRGAKILEKSKRAKRLADFGDRAAESVSKATGDRNFVPIFSIPKWTATKTIGWVGKQAKTQDLINSYKWLQKGTKSEAIIHEAINLGLMSGMSTLTINPANWKETYDEAFASILSGGAMGATFGGIGNYVKLKNAFKSSDPAVRQRAETVVKGMVGAVAQGMFMHAHTPDDVKIPPAEQVYEYVLGAYFGAKAQTGLQRAVQSNRDLITKSREKNVPISELAKDRNLNKETVEILEGMRTKKDAPLNLFYSQLQKRGAFLDYNPQDFYDVNVIGGTHKGKAGKMLAVNEETGRATLDLGDGRNTTIKVNNLEYREAGSNWTQTEKVSKSGKTKLIIKEIEGVEPSTGQKATLRLVFQDGEILRKKIIFEDGAVTEPGIGRFGNESKGFRKLRESDNPDVVFERLDGLFEPIKNEYKPGESFIEDHTTAVSDVMELIEVNRPTNTYINKNLENASYEIQNQLRDAGVPLDRVSIQSKIKKAVTGKSDYNWNSIVESLNKEFADAGQLNISQGNSLNNLGRYLRRFSKSEQNKQVVDMVHLNLNNTGVALEPFGHLNAKGQVVANKRRHVAKWVGKKYTNPEPFTYNEISTREGIIETNQGLKPIVTKVFREKDLANPKWLKSKLNNTEKNARYKHVRKTKDLYEDKKFVLGGSGEKDTIIFTDLQFPTTPRPNNVNAPRDYIRAATKGHPEITKTLNSQLKDFKKIYELTQKSQEQGVRELGKKYANINYAYQNMVASKMMWIENLNQKSFKEILDANKKAIKEGRPKPYIDNAIDLNKRFPVLHASEPAWDRAVYEGLKDVENGNLKIMLVNALNKNPKAKYEKIISKALGKELDAHRDGIYVLRRDIFDAAIDDAGLPRNVASAKGTLLTTNGNKGLLLGKYAYVRATEALDASFKKDGIHGELYDTSAKQIGERELYDVSLKKGQSVYTDRKGKEVAPSVVAEEIPIIDHRMNLGVYENPKKNLENAVSALQRWEWSYSPYMKKAGVSQKEIKDFFRELTQENFEGKESINKLLRKESKITEEELAKVREAEIDDMNVDLVMKIASSHKDSALYRTIWDKLHRRLNEVQEFASGNDFVDTEAIDYMNEMLNARSMSDNILKMAPDITPLINNHKWVNKYSSMVLKNYLLNRINKPKEKYSSKHIFLPYDRYMQTNKLTSGLKPGEIIMYKDAAQAKVNVNGKEMTIEKALQVDPNQEYVLLRVPADNISGQRVVKVKLVLNEKGTGIVVHPEDMHFMGGADLDIDSGFMYRSTPKKFREAIKNSKYTMKDVDPTGPEAVEQFSTKNIAGISTDKILKDPAYMLDPMIAEQISNNARTNNVNLGIAVSTGQGYGRMLDYVLSNPGKEYKAFGLPKEVLEVTKNFKEPVLEIKSTGNVESYMKEVQKAVNMYADAGKFGALLPSGELKQKMFRDTGVVVSVKDKQTGVSIELKQSDAQKVIDNHSVFGKSQAFKSSLNGVYYEDGIRKQMTIDQIRENAKEYLDALDVNNIKYDDMPGVLTVKAEKLLNFESNDNFIGNINTEKLNKLYAETVARAEKDKIITSYNRRDLQGNKAKNIDTFKDFVSSDIDFITTVRKLEKTYEKARREMSDEQFKKMQNDVLDAATELRVEWQLEKYWNTKRKVLASQGPVKLADAINKSIELQAANFRTESPIKEQLFYDMLTSNVVTGVNQKSDILRKKMLDRLMASKNLRGQNVRPELESFMDAFTKDKLEALTKDPLSKNKSINLDLMYSMNAIPVKYLKDHFKIRQQIEESIQGYTAPVLEVQKQRKQQIREKIRGYQEGKARQELIDKVNEQVADSAELREMRSDIEAILDREPELLAKIEQVFPSMSVRPYATSLIDNVYGRSLKDATAGDVQNFINFFKTRMTAEEWIKYKSGDPKFKELYNQAWYQFPETVVNKIGPFDLTFVPVDGPRKVLENGKLVEKKDLLVPMSGFERLNMDNKLATEIVTGLTDQLNNKFLKGRFDWLQSVGDQSIQRLAVEAAIGKHEGVNAKKHKTYQDGLDKSNKILEEIGKKEYSVAIDGKSKPMTGEQIVNRLAKDINETLGWVNKNLLHTNLTFREFLFEGVKGEPRIREVIRRRIQPLLRDTNKRESLLEGKIDKSISNDNLFKFLELWKRSEQVREYDGRIILNRDLKKIDRAEYDKWLDKQITEIDAKYGVGQIMEGYFPHRNIPKKIVDEYIESKSADKGGLDANAKRYLNEEVVLGTLGRADGGAMQPYNNIILQQGSRDASRLKVKDKTAQTLSPNQRRRSANLPEYEKSINVLSQYMGQILKARYNALMALSNAETIRTFEASKYKDGTPVMGSKENREHWGRFMRINTLKDIGGQHILPEQWLNDKAFPMSKLYTGFTEGQLYKRLEGMGKFFGKEDMFLPKDRNGKTSPEALSDRINWLSNLEARVSTSTLLFNTRGWVYNMFGGNANTLISAGLTPFKKAYDYKYLRSIIPDPALKKGDVDNRGKDWFLNWAKEKGVIETFWTSELSANTSFRAIKGMKGYDSFINELRMASGLKKDVRTDKRSVMEVLQKYNIDQKATDLGGFFMKHAEQELRLRAFLAHYVKAREVFAARGATFTADDPAILKIALEGTVGSQYLYNNVSRPVATASPAGRIMSRFQLWAGNSLRKRKDIVKMAKDSGYTGEAYNKFERMMAADMFMFAMASMLPYSMFDATLPPPYSYYTEMSQMLYGSPQEKERAFFGTLPYPLNITGLITPPSARYITQPVGNLMTGDWERFWDYQIYTWFPYGMVLKTGNDIIKSPIKAVDKLSGFPLYRLNYMSKEDDKGEE